MIDFRLAKISNGFTNRNAEAVQHGTGIHRMNLGLEELLSAYDKVQKYLAKYLFPKFNL